MPNFSIPNTINPGDPSDANKAMANWNQLVNDLNGSGAEGGGKIDKTNLVTKAVTSSILFPSAGFLGASSTGSSIALSNAAVDIAGCSLSITPVVASTLFVWVIADFNCAQIAGNQGNAIVDLLLDTVSQGQVKSMQSNSGGVESWRQTQSGLYALSLTAAAHTVKLQGLKDSTLNSGQLLGPSTVNVGRTGFGYLLIAV